MLGQGEWPLRATQQSMERWEITEVTERTAAVIATVEGRRASVALVGDSESLSPTALVARCEGVSHVCSTEGEG
jgi:hypothetical protein